MQKIFLIFIIILTFIKNAFSSLENITNIKYYMNQICSYNGVPNIIDSNNTVICSCEDKYANEPRESEKKYIHNQFIQCTYRKKKRFTAFFLAAITPFGLDFCYLGYFIYFIIIAVINFTIIVFNFISIVLNYQLEKKNEEAKQKLKIKKNTNKFDIRNLAELNDRCVKNFNLTSKILIIFLLLFWISNAFIQGMGFLNDINGVPTENDMGYLFQTPDR